MAAYVPVRWVSPLLYGVVLVGGLYSAAVGLDSRLGPTAWRTAGFVIAIGALFALEAAGHRRPDARVPLLLARCALIGAVVLLDVSGLSQVLFVLVPFTAYFAFGRTAALALGALCPAGLLTAFLLTVPGWYRDQERVADLLMLCVGLVLAISMAAVAVGEQRARLELEAYAARVAELSAATERNRLARDIHDSLGHHLTAMSVQLEMASDFQTLDPDAAQRALNEARRSVRLALGDVRQSVRALRDEATRPTLAAALAALAQDGAAGPRVTVEVSGDEDGYGAVELTALYRAAQEAVTNARRHARASQVTVVVRLAGGAARLEVTDDGRGFAPDAAVAGFGLLGMRERVHLVAGSVEVDSSPGAGTQVTVTVPRGTAAKSSVDGRQ
ncbi:sensor histidine kinase [Streptomyces cyaneochromogenes]|uniref:Oxygen sensor histidine kinase NreB n=1 Tax=Streptomyces cyaneochromogenes TaxID=2496836 RepID=A0A3S9MJD1_9ACTN|nr:sensor histidine kinase [Streptomyces cyaneochromogenes]AZQ39261.1 sensor histidine kinase [Streptomyces cyaneochromogenes]